MKVFTIEMRYEGLGWIVKYLHKQSFREVYSRLGNLTSNPNWRVRRVKTPKALYTIKRIFHISLKENGYEGVKIKWVN
jgi:hypothetical protein